jgi:hypothetical protein
MRRTPFFSTSISILTLPFAVTLALGTPDSSHATCIEAFRTPLDKVEDGLSVAELLLVPSAFHEAPFPSTDNFSEWERITELLVTGVEGERVEAGGILCQKPLALANEAAFVGGFVTPTPADYLVDTAAFEANLGLKFCKPVVVRPENRTFQVTEADGCTTVIEDQRTWDNFGFFFGVESPLSPPTCGWGPLGTPSVVHNNTDIFVRIKDITNNLGLKDFVNETVPDDDAFFPSKPRGFDGPETSDIELKMGRNLVQWEVAPLAGPLDLLFIYLPINLPQNWKYQKSLEFFLDVIIELGLTVGGEFTPSVATESVVRMTQTVDVIDPIPPMITSSPSAFEFEGTEIGGASFRTRLYKATLEDALSVSDECNDPSVLDIVAPPTAIWPVDQTTPVTWRVLDPGPNAQGGRNSAETVQQVTVVDTIAPTVLQPQGLVMEYDPAFSTPPLPLAVRAPRVFDFVDAMPEMTNNALAQPGVLMEDGLYKFPAGVTRIEWQATDQSGNVSAVAEQIVNLKELGQNNAPVGRSQTGEQAQQALSFEPIEIMLDAVDPDGDPLWFRIARQPDDGFFIAPLLPYFFEDFRVINPGVERCSPVVPDELPGRHAEDIVDPQYVDVAEDGTTYVLNAPIVPQPGCDNDALFQTLNMNRITVLDEDGDFLTGRDLPRTSDLFGLHVDDERGFIVYSTFGGAFSKLDLVTLETTVQYQLPETVPGVVAPGRKGVIDENEILYLTSGVSTGEIFFWDLRDAPLDTSGEFPVADLDLSRQIGSLQLSDPAMGYVMPAVDIDIDSKRNVYVTTIDRVFKFSPVTFDEEGTPQLGEMIGWMGACSGGSGCDVTTGTSRGYSCTFESCVADFTRPDGPGQFGSLGGIAIDPNDILYVTGFKNSRVQRFTPEGFFAGQARSECSPDELCFVLGDFGKPTAVSVNSGHFYVLDKALDVVHVFETSVVTPVSETQARVEYSSDNRFFDETDSFDFIASDGLADSAPATVEIAVTRNFQAPIPTDRQYMTDEDVPIQIVPPVSDPDFDPTMTTIVSGPSHGTLSGRGPEFTYTPDPDFNGTDSFTFTARDEFSVADNAAKVTIKILPVNDPPVVTPRTNPVQAGTGYDFTVEVEFEDPDGPDNHTVTADFGSGPVAEGKIESGVPTGPLLVESGDGKGFAIAADGYDTAGDRTVEVCVFDNVSVDESGNKSTTAESESGCTTIEVDVAPMADVSVGFMDANDPVTVGQSLTWTVSVKNSAPETAAGTTASDVGVDFDFGTGIGNPFVSSLETLCVPALGGGPLGGARFTCNVGELGVGQDREILVTGLLASTSNAMVRVTADSTTPDPYLPNLALLLPAVACPGDSDAECDDGNPCNGVETCNAGICADGDDLSCKDDNPCTSDVCDEQQGCMNEPVEGSCDDGDLCNGPDVCAAGVCVSDAPLDCDDANVCTLDFCDPDGGCFHTEATGSCTDGCSTGAMCSGGICAGGFSPCDDVCERCDEGACAPACGVPISRSASPNASDALGILQAAVDLIICGLCECDVDDSGAIAASDALRVLQAAVGLPAALSCPAVSGFEYSTTTLYPATSTTLPDLR